MIECIDLEIGIRRDGDAYAVELRCSQPGSDADLCSGYTLPGFDTAELLQYSLDDASYGRYLTEKLLSPTLGKAQERQVGLDQSPKEILSNARSIAQSKGLPLRLRLFIGPNAPELQDLCWEKLRDPQGDTPLLTDENVLFSRYLSSLDWHPVRLRRKTDLRALVVVANPDLADYPHLSQLDIEGELKRAHSSLESIAVTVLASTGTDQLAPAGQATLRDILTHLRDGYDILYLVCHGTLDKGGPSLWLEDQEGRVERISGDRLVAGLRNLTLRPRLTVLASCQAAGNGQGSLATSGNALLALGPRLAEACIPAVIAMQGDIAMETVADFMPVFFRELQRDGQIDRAIAAARSHVQAPGSGWWRPVLFMRLKSGSIWYTPGFSGDEHEVETWPPLLSAIEGDEMEGYYCTPILGSGLADALLGSHHEIARQWAEEHRFPMAPYCREDLSQVAQYLAVLWQDRALRIRLRKHLSEELLERYGTILLGDPTSDLLQTLHEFVQRTTAQGMVCEPLEPYRILAKLPFHIYITADPTNLLEETLIAEGKEPQAKICPWREEIDPEHYELDGDPSPQCPLVYYLFGSFRVPQSLVLTEDNCYDFLIGITARKKRIPPVVRSALAAHELLFLGFRPQEREFRVLLRAIMNCEGRTVADVANVAAQVYPGEESAQEPERACRYLERYFQTAKINIYWGSAEDFVRELGRRWQEKEGKL